jgi:hypothetical protein
MWNVEMEIIPAITGEIGTARKLCRKYLSYITGKHDNNHIGHCKHSSKSSNVKDKTYITRHNIACTIY